jgi:HK97 family phage major capsid protein
MTGSMSAEVERVLAEARSHPGGTYPDGSAGPSYDPAFDIADLENAAVPYAAGVQQKALQHWLRTGSRTYIEQKALIEDATGQVLVPKDIAVDVLNVARSQGLLRDLVTVRPTQRLKVPVGTLSAATVSWGQLETGSTPPDAGVAPASPVGGDITVCDLTSLVKIGTDELDDTPAATSQMLAEVLGDAVAEAEDAAIASGTGSGQPRGLTLASNITAVPAGQKTTAAASNTPTVADLQGLPWKLPDRYRGRAVWLIHPGAASKIAALTLGSGVPLWPNPGNPDPRSGGGLLGWPAYVVPGLPDPATAGTGDASVLFTDVRSAYRLVDRQRLTLQRLTQGYAAQGLVGMLLRYRVGGDLVRPGAVAVYLL